MRSSSSAAAEIGPGETGLLALDWWNGNRTILADADLTGAIFGLGLHTTREQIYRALLESIAFGSRRIMDNFEEHGLVLSQIVACGGIAERSPLMMQLLADTSGREVHVPDVAEIPARGAALFGGRGGRRIRGHRQRRRGDPAEEGAHVQAGPRGQEDLRPRVRDLPQAVRHARPRPRCDSCTTSSASAPKGERREPPTANRPARDHAGALRRHDPGDHRAPGRVRGRGREASWLRSPTCSSRGPARNREDVEAIARELAGGGRRRDRDRDAHLRPGDAHGARAAATRGCR